MYRVSPQESRTDLYQTGERANQVFDPSITIHALDINAAAKERAAAAKAKKEQENQDDIEAQLKSMGGKAIMSHDTSLIADKTQAVIDYTRKNIDKLKSGDMNARMGFDRVLGDLQTTTAQSVDKRKKWEAANELIAANPNKYRPDAIDKQLSFAGSLNAGNFNYNPADYLKENVDLNKDFKENLRPQLEDVAQGGTFDYVNPETGVKTTITKDNLTPEQTVHFLKDRLADHKIYDQAHYDLTQSSKATQKKYELPDGSLDVNQYYIDRMMPYAVIKRDKQTQIVPHESEWQYKERTGAIPEKDKTNVTSTVTDSGHDITIGRNNENNEKMLAPITLGNNQVVNVNQVHFHKDKAGYIQGYATVPLTKDEQTENTKVIADNIANGTDNPLPFQEKTIRISKQQANQVIHENYKGIDNVEDLYRQQYNEGQVNFQHNDYRSKKESSAQKEKLYIVGGKAYKESALKKQGYDISTLEEYK